jgi:hypothetical protein
LEGKIDLMIPFFPYWGRKWCSDTNQLVSQSQLIVQEVSWSIAASSVCSTKLSWTLLGMDPG